jgi:hypothetical protein
MPDDQIVHSHSASETLKEFVPPVLVAVGVISLLRASRLLRLIAAGVYLYDLASKTDADRKKRGRDLPSRRALGARLDEEIADSFPASDPVSFSGTTAGAP